MTAPATTTPQALRWAAQTWPDEIAIVDEQWTDEPITLTWRQLLGEAWCSPRRSSRPASPTVTASPWGPQQLPLADRRAGHPLRRRVLVLLNTRYTISEAAQIIERADARVIVTVGEFVGTNRLADVLGNPVSEGRTVVGIDLDDRGSLPSPAVPWPEFLTRGTELGAADARLTRSHRPTSPTSCSPPAPPAHLGVLAEHRHTIAGAHAWGANGELGPGDKYLQANPYFHTFGYKAGILPSVLFGTTMVPLAVFSPRRRDADDRRAQDHRLPGAPRCSRRF